MAHEKIPNHILYHKKIILPDDAVVVRGGKSCSVSIDSIRQNDVIYDIGPKTISRLSAFASSSNTVLWNGTLGLCEDGFVNGTKALAKVIKKSKAYSIVGGGDTVAAVRQLKLEKNFDFVSTGGGAMLEFLAKGTLPGIAAIEFGLAHKRGR
ncbi:MAG TPA: phosphoglycerate kinase [Patescibacteria group bacterium]|nr:phosphoglycerate kinase [Patescibacteria group bacterium]